jgi:UDP-N-acetylmuramyl tripeptide synthase
MNLNLLFTYFGPNRRSDATMVEAMLDFDQRDENAIEDEWDCALVKIQSELATEEPLLHHHLPAPGGQAGETMARFAQLFNSIGLHLQRSCGHEVQESGYLIQPEYSRVSTWFEQDEAGVGEQAAILSLSLLGQAFESIKLNLGKWQTERSFQDTYPKFSVRAKDLAQSPDTSAIINAAGQQGVPVIRLERDPYTPIQGKFRIRMNSMLMLGHSASHQIIDGTFALDKSQGVYKLLTDRQKVMRAAARMDMPIPPAYRDHQPLISSQRSGRAARQFGFPLVVKTASRELPGTSLEINDVASLSKAVAKAMKLEHQFIIEKFIAGKTWKLLIAGHELLAVFSGQNGQVFNGEVHTSFSEMAISAAKTLNVGLLLITIVSPGISGELNQSQAAVVDLDIAPRLDRLFAATSTQMARAAQNYVRWLVPAGKDSKIPVASVTGTNGKTTTSRMLAHIMQRSGQVTGLQCTDGRYINGHQVKEGDDSALTGHFCFYEDKSVQFAVLETHHRGIATTGFAFKNCELAICTNISDDHLGNLGLETVSDIGILKRALIERASETVVLNADDSQCMAMLPHVSARNCCLCSMDSTADELASRVKGESYCCVLEPRETTQWIVIHKGAQSHDIIAVSDIPATFGGLARFNVMNAMQAIAGSHAMGVKTEVIRDAMSSFSMSSKNTPSRVNFYHGLPFQVLVDFAHNPDGMRRIAEFTGAMTVSGRRILAFSAFRSEQHCKDLSRKAAGHFDHYVLKKYGVPEGYTPTEQDMNLDSTGIMHSELLLQGVKEQQVSVIEDELPAIRYALDMAVPGDLVVLLLGYTALKKIEDFMQDYSAEQYPEVP